MVWLIRLDAGKREDGDEEDKGEGHSGGRTIKNGDLDFIYI